MRSFHTTEQEISRLRFLHHVCMRGDRLSSDDVGFIQEMETKIRMILEGIDEIKERLKND